jgi:hypothetical protein
MSLRFIKDNKFRLLLKTIQYGAEAANKKPVLRLRSGSGFKIVNRNQKIVSAIV